MTGFRVGVADPIIAARPAADTFTRANYLGAVASRVDSFWFRTISTFCSPARCGNRSIAAQRSSYQRLTPIWSPGPCSRTSPRATDSAAFASAWL
jgi:hypothetical protein